MRGKILVIEDEMAINDLISMNLEVTGYEVVSCLDGLEAEETLKKEADFDLALVDIMLPGKDGFALLPELKAAGIPVIFLTAKADVQSKVRGLKEGAEDYIVKPFEILELIARINVVLRRTKKNDDVFRISDVEVHLDRHDVFKNGERVQLAPQEYELLEVLILNRNMAMSREKLLELAWGWDYMGDTKTVDVHIRKLRKKLGLEKKICTINKLGYRLETE